MSFIPKPDNIKSEIYVRLLDEGIDVYRPVRAKHRYKTVWQILDQEIPVGESWEFQPGELVRVELKTISNGEQLVIMETMQPGSPGAIEEARRTTIFAIGAVVAIGFIQYLGLKFTGCFSTRSNKVCQPDAVERTIFMWWMLCGAFALVLIGIWVKIFRDKKVFELGKRLDRSVIQIWRVEDGES